MVSRMLYDACSILELALITSSRVFFLHCKIYAFDNPEGPRGKIPRPPDRQFFVDTLGQLPTKNYS